MSDSLGDRLLSALEDLLSPVTDAVTDPWWLGQLLGEIGAEAASVGGSALSSALEQIAQLIQQIEALTANPSPSFGAIASLLESARNAFSAIRGLSAAGGPAAQLESLGDDLVQFLVSRYMDQNHPLAVRIGVLLTLIQAAEELPRTPAVVAGGQLLRDTFILDRYRLDRLPSLIRDPLSVLRAEYLNGLATTVDANAMADKLFVRISRILSVLGVAWSYGFTEINRPAFGDVAPLVDHALTIYAAQTLGGAAADAGVMLTLSAADAGDLGLVMSPFGGLTFSNQVGLWQLALSLNVDVQAFAYGRNGFTLLADGSSVDVTATFKADLPKPTDGSAFLFGSANGTRIEIAGASLSAKIGFSSAGVNVELDAGVSSATIVIAPGNGDGFLQSVLPADGAKAEFDLGLSFSNTQGLKVKGGGGLDVTLPAGLSIGGVVFVNSIHIGLHADDSGVTAECSATAGLSLGPVHVVVDRMGLLVTLTFPQQGGNLGPVDATFGFKPPSGLGIDIDAGIVTGGGFLTFDPAKSEYSGAARLAIEDVSISAFGLVQTQPEVSFLLLIAITFPEPIELGMGFSLKGVGGLAGLNRSIALDALETAVWKGTAKDLLFPSAPITNAAAILSELDTLFPAAEGRYVFGPTAEIVWGTPPLVTAEVGLLLEVPEPIRLALVGNAVAQFPPDKPVVVLKVSFAGGIDFGSSRFFFDASLNGSRIESYPISGDLSLRSSWVTPKNLALAVGGFNPHFQPPAGFPSLARVSLDISDGPLHFHLATYLAVTTNTFQVGATVDLKAHVCDCDVAGHFAFDALFIKNPFSFIVDVDASASISVDGETFAGIHVSGNLSGPAPWHAKGSASISLLFFSVGVSFDHTWGSAAPAALPAVDPWSAALAPALADPGSWGSASPPCVHPVVTFAPDPSGTTVLDPASAVVLDQKAVPLNQPIERFAETALSTAVEFDMANPSVNGVAVDPLDWSPVTSEFAPAQFSNMTDDEKLSAESFVSLPSGMAIGAGATVGTSVGASLTYDLIILDSTRQPGPRIPFLPTRAMQMASAATGPAARAPWLVAGLGSFAPQVGAMPKASLAARTFSIVSSANLAVQAEAVASTRYEAALALAAFSTQNRLAPGSIQAVPQSEAK